MTSILSTIHKTKFYRKFYRTFPSPQLIFKINLIPLTFSVLTLSSSPLTTSSPPVPLILLIYHILRPLTYHILTLTAVPTPSSPSPLQPHLRSPLSLRATTVVCRINTVCCLAQGVAITLLC